MWRRSATCCRCDREVMTMLRCSMWVPIAAGLLAGLVISPGRDACAAEIKVISAGAVRGVIGEMIEDYARQSGHKFNFTVGPTGRLREVIASGEPADVIIASAPL